MKKGRSYHASRGRLREKRKRAAGRRVYFEKKFLTTTPRKESSFFKRGSLSS